MKIEVILGQIIRCIVTRTWLENGFEHFMETNKFPKYFDLINESWCICCALEEGWVLEND